MPLTSAVIPVYNQASFVADAIDSVFDQTRPPDELIVVDDGSTDETPRVLERYSSRARIVRQENQGVSAARNKGAEVATGQFLAFLDADDVWLPGKLERQTARLLSDPDLGLVHCGVEEIDERGERLDIRCDGLEGWVAQEMLLFRRPVVLGGGSGAMIPRQLFWEIGGFDRRLSTSADWDLYFRLATRRPIGFIPEVLLRYRLHGDSMHRNVEVMERDMLLAYEKAFLDEGSRLRGLRRRAYGNLHAVLAGSYFGIGRRRDFARHAWRSLVLTPRSIRRFAAYPLRWWRRHRRREAARFD